MKYDLDRDNLEIVRAFSRMCEYAMEEYEIVSFFKNLVDSDYFQKFDSLYTVFSQSKHYMLTIFKEEMDSKGIELVKINEEEKKFIPYYEEAAFWMGFVFLTWRIVDNLPKGYLLNYDIDRLVYGYETLHTTSVSVSIDKIKEDFKK